MKLELMVRDARPTGGIWQLSDVAKRADVIKQPVLVRGAGATDDVRHFDGAADWLPWGSVACFPDIPPGAKRDVYETARRADWREWNYPGREAHEVMYVRSRYEEGREYQTHQRYLMEAVRRTTGPMLELGCGEGSTPLLHEHALASLRLLISVERDPAWLARFAVDLKHTFHVFEQRADPAQTLRDAGPSQRFGVVFVDHAPGETRKDAIKRARDRADYIVVHDTEEHSYGVWDVLESFKFKRHFRFMRPWTSVASMTREIFTDPHCKELP